MKRKSDVVLSGSGAASASSAEGQHVVDTLTIQPLGAGQEVGRSCIILRHKNKTIMYTSKHQLLQRRRPSLAAEPPSLRTALGKKRTPRRPR
jgi:hypothetical protein